jgi:hypothetical protein
MDEKQISLTTTIKVTESNKTKIKDHIKALESLGAINKDDAEVLLAGSEYL